MESKINRKEFLKKGTLAGLGASMIPSNIALGKKAPAFIQGKDDRKARIAVIGVGSQGGNIVQGLTFQDDVIIPAVCDINPERVAHVQKMVVDAGGAEPTGYSNGPKDYINLLERDDIDGVAIATPWELHTEMTLAALKHGK